MHHRRLQNTKDKREILKAARRDRALCKKTKQSCFRLASTMETSRSQNGHHWLNGQEQTLGDSEGQEAWHAAVRGVVKSQTGLSNWRTTWLCTLHTCLYNLYFLLPILFSYLGSLPFSYMDLRNGQMKPQSVRRSRIVKKAQRGDVVECQPFLRGP